MSDDPGSLNSPDEIAGLEDTATLDDGTDHATDDGVLRRGVCVGRYLVLGALGSGGMGTVYTAYDPDLDRKVALKLLRGELLLSTDRAEAQARLLREAQAVAKLDHPNIVSVFDVGRFGDRLFVAMELIEGLSLQEWLASHERSWREILRVFEQAGRGLAAAHKKGIVHRDFKPNNVMVSPDGRARVVDFGLARAVRTGYDGSIPPGRAEEWRSPESALFSFQTTAGKALGTPAYMAPEQRGRSGADARTDQFSFCLALYQALFAELPFAGDNLDEYSRNVAGGVLRDRPVEARVPGWLHRTLIRGLAADPAGRYPDMDGLLGALGRDRARHRPSSWWAGSIVLVILLVAGFLLLGRRQSALCTGADEQLARVWNEQRKSDLREAFLATNLPLAVENWSRVVSGLDSYAADWSELYTESCEATRIRGERSEEMLDLQMTCLDSRLHELRGLTSLLARADSDLVQNAVTTTQSLGDLESCRNLGALTALLQPPDESVRAAIGPIREKLAEAHAFEFAGRYADGSEAARTALREATNLGYRPLIGEARLLAGIMEGRAGDRQAMKEHMVEAVGISLATHHEELLAEAMTFLIVSSFARGDLEAAETWGRLAESALEGLGGNDRIEAFRQVFLGMTANKTGDFDQAIEHLRSALETTKGKDPLFRGPTLNYLGIADLGAGDPEAALQHLQEALATTERAYPAGHPLVGDSLRRLGDLLFQLGRLEESLDVHQRCLEILEKAQGAKHQDLAFPLLSMGRIELALGRPEEAIVHLERAVGLWESHTVDPVDLARGSFRLADALWSRDRDLQRARSLALRARKIFVEQGERTQADLLEADRWLRERGIRADE